MPKQRFDRNYLRRQVLPPLRARWPAAAAHRRAQRPPCGGGAAAARRGWPSRCRAGGRRRGPVGQGAAPPAAGAAAQCAAVLDRAPRACVAPIQPALEELRVRCWTRGAMRSRSSPGRAHGCGVQADLRAPASARALPRGRQRAAHDAPLTWRWALRRPLRLPRRAWRPAARGCGPRPARPRRAAAGADGARAPRRRAAAPGAGRAAPHAQELTAGSARAARRAGAPAAALRRRDAARGRGPCGWMPGAGARAAARVAGGWCGAPPAEAHAEDSAAGRSGLC